MFISKLSTIKRHLVMLGVVFVAMTSVVEAALTASPLILDETVSPRDIFERTVIISNDTGMPIRVFPSVNQIALDEGGSIKEFIPASVGDRATSVTSWMSFPRGRLELPPGASTTLTIAFSINPNAAPGLYHAFIGLGSGSNRDEAEAMVMRGTAPGVIVRVSVADTSVEALRLTRFTVNRLVVQEGSDAVSYALTNPGDVPLVPTGEVIVYNARGEEVATIPLNEGARSIAPGETVELTAPVSAAGLFGRYKAFLSLEYGEGQATVHDTAFFYVAPWHYLLTLFGGLFLCTLGMVFWWRRTLFPADEDRHDGHVTLHVRPGKTRNEHNHDITLTKSTDQS
jgi:hypothetical protein